MKAAALSSRWLRVLPLAFLCLFACTTALNAAPSRLSAGARAIHRQMTARGARPGEISLALAGYFAQAKRQREVEHFVRKARQEGIAASRIDLVLGSFFRSVGRYDAALSTLVRVLVSHEEQPYALVELWKTLYESQLRQVEIQSDQAGIRQRLVSSGLHFPQAFTIGDDSAAESQKLTVTAYNELLAGKTRFAAELFEAAIEELPSNAKAHRGLGIARARLQDYHRAAGAYLLYLELNPNASDAGEVDRALMEYWKAR